MRRRKVIPIFLLLAAVGAGLGVYHVTRQAALRNGDVLRVFGNVETVDTEIGFKLPGRVERRLVDEGQPVKAGQVIATLESADLKADLALRRAESAAAQAALKELENGSRPEEKDAADAAVRQAEALLDELEHGSRPQQIKAAEATLERAVVERERLKIELARATQLLKERTIAQETYDRQKANYDVSLALVREAREQLDLIREGPREEQIRRAREALKEARARRQLVFKGPRDETKEQAAAKVRQTQAAVLLAETRLSYAELRSPGDGIVVVKNAEPGEFLAAGAPVVTIADLRNVWLRAYVDYDACQRIAIGQAATLRTDAPPHRVYQGRVSFISPESEFTPKNVQTQKERSKLVYRIKIDFDNEDMGLKRGMPADAEIQLTSPPTSMPGPAK